MGLLSKISKGFKKVVKKVIPKEIRQAPQAILGGAVNLATGNVMGAVGSLASPFVGSQSYPSHSPAYPMPDPAYAGISMPGVLGTAAKISEVLQGINTARGWFGSNNLPAPTSQGGQSGQLMPTMSAAASGLGTDRLGRPLALPLEFDTVARPMRINGRRPSGYVVVNHPTLGKLAMLKGVARSAGLWSPKAKPPISAGDWRKLKVADRTRKKVKKIAGAAGFSAVPKGRGRTCAPRRKK